MTVKMKVLYWNVNGLRAVDRKEMLSPLLSAVAPEVMGIQEIKANAEQLSFFAKRYPDYLPLWHSAEQAGYSGTGLLIRRDFLSRHGLSENDWQVTVGMVGSSRYEHDHEGRVQCWHIPKWSLSILNIYFPNGGKSESAWDDKLIFYDEFLLYVNRLRQAGNRVIWGGDVNCAHQPIDLARPLENEGAIGFRPEERAWISRCLENDWVDVFRHRHPQEVVYSWWHMVTRARTRNIGWRIDYAFVDRALIDQVRSISYLNEVQGSDHCPLLLDINGEQ